jgi:hypothetical protein
MSELIKGSALATRFLLQVCTLGVLGYWGFTTGGSALAKVRLGIGVPLDAAVAWGTFVAPKALVKVPGAVRLLVEVGVRVRVGHRRAVRSREHPSGHGIDAGLRA